MYNNRGLETLDNLKNIWEMSARLYAAGSRVLVLAHILVEEGGNPEADWQHALQILSGDDNDDFGGTLGGTLGPIDSMRFKSCPVMTMMISGFNNT